MTSRRTTALPLPSRHRLLAILLTLATAAASLVALRTPAATAQVPACVTAVPGDDIVAGTVATGLTVERGTTPDEFTAEVVGVLRDGIAPGIDMIVAELDSPAIQRAGVWAGMSGSPVYTDDGQLLGAVAYGFSWSPSPVAGLVPGEQILALYDYPQALDGMAEQARVPAAMLAKLDLGEGAPAHAMAEGRGATIRQLQLPVAVSGLRDNRLTEFRERLELGDRTALTRSGSATGTADVDEIVPGSNFAAAMSHGDFTVAGVGTTTDVCNGQALAFGHPFTLSGAADMSVHAADALLVEVDDVFGSFKLANVGGMAGALDQDRFAGIRGQLGEEPTATTFTSWVRSNDLGRSDTSHSWIVDADRLSDLSAFAMMSHMDVVADRWGPGHLWYSWTLSGTAVDGTPFRVSRDNRVASRWDVSFETLFDYWDWMWMLERNPHMDLEVDEVSIRARMTDGYERRQISDLRVAVNGGRLRPVDAIDRLRLSVGDEVRFVVVTEQQTGLPRPRRTTFDLVVPRRLADKKVRLVALGGEGLARPWEFDRGEDLQDMLDNIASHPEASDIKVRWQRRNRRNWNLQVFGEQTAETSRVTTGRQGVPVTVRPL